MSETKGQPILSGTLADQIAGALPPGAVSGGADVYRLPLEGAVADTIGKAVDEGTEIYPFDSWDATKGNPESRDAMLNILTNVDAQLQRIHNARDPFNPATTDALFAQEEVPVRPLKLNMSDGTIAPDLPEVASAGEIRKTLLPQQAGDARAPLPEPQKTPAPIQRSPQLKYFALMMDYYYRRAKSAVMSDPKKALAAGLPIGTALAGAGIAGKGKRLKGAAIGALVGATPAGLMALQTLRQKLSKPVTA